MSSLFFRSASSFFLRSAFSRWALAFSLFFLSISFRRASASFRFLRSTSLRRASALAASARFFSCSSFTSSLRRTFTEVESRIASCFSLDSRLASSLS